VRLDGVVQKINGMREGEKREVPGSRVFVPKKWFVPAGWENPVMDF
jgi:hypothetical protein